MSSGLTETSGRLITRNFILISSAAFVAFASFHFLIPVLPLFIESLGGSTVDIGLVVGSFTISSFAIRLFIGPRLDAHGRRGVLLAGLATFAAGVCLLIPASSVLSLVLVRIVQGAGWGALNTAANTLVADLAPANRRGEAMAIFGAVINLAMAIGPALGIALTLAAGFGAVFISAAVLAVVALVAAVPVGETREQTHATQAVANAPRVYQFFNRDALQPSVTMFLVTLTFGAMMPFLPVYAGAETVGIFYVVFSVVLLISRPITGRMSDVLGRKAVLAPSIVVASAGLFALSISGELPFVLTTAVLYGIGFGAVFPSLSALTVDLCAVHQRGTAMATLTAAFDMGVAVGSVVFGVIIDAASYRMGFIAAGLMGVVAFGYFVATAPTVRRAQPE